jgi:NAD(P)-dependent dehydrogenase (short-subunit alcohol dehydrogenase family)
MVTWLITGAASGIGREVARLLAERGASLVLWDRDASGLSSSVSLLGSAVRDHCVVDVVDAEAVQAAAARAGAIDHVVHCAGILRVGDAATMSAHDYRAMFEVNVLGSIHVARALVPVLKRQGTRKQPARLIFLSSVAGLRAVPTLAGYSATKYAVVGFARALADEVSNSFVDVKVVCPPPVDTPMVQSLAALPAVYRLSPPKPVDRIAKALLAGIERPGFIVLLDAGSRLMWSLDRVLPKVLDRALRWAKD